MINGVPSDDFYMEFYDNNGNLTNIVKSDYTMDAETFERLSTATEFDLEQCGTDRKENWVYSFENGVWQLTIS